MVRGVTYIKKRISIILLFLLVGSMLFATNCVKRVPPQKEMVQPAQLPPEEQKLSNRENILHKALVIECFKFKYKSRILIKDPLAGKNVWYMMDCFGFVTAVYRAANISIFGKLDSRVKGANGVRLIYDTLKKLNKIYKRKKPRAADIVFFDNTWDRIGNGKINDELTHVGIVLAVDENGTITFIHSSRSGGVSRDHMNLYYPDKETFNSKIRPRGKNDPPNTKYLAGELFNAFGTVFDIPQEGDD